MGLECIVYMGELDVQRQAPNVARMRMLGATVVPAMSGNRTLKDATNEALRDWICNPEDTFYLIGSVVGPHPYPDMVARLQAIISEEIKWQIKEQTEKDYPDYVVACVGGGSNAAGSFFHFLDDDRVKLVAVEASGLGIDSGETAATIAIGSKGIIHGSKTFLGNGYIGYYDGAAFSIPVDSQHVEAALLWLQFLGQPDIQPDVITSYSIHYTKLYDTRARNTKKLLNLLPSS